MITVSVSVQPLASVTVTVYVPAESEDAAAEVAPEDQLYEYPGVPPAPEAVAAPSLPPLQLTFVGDPIEVDTAVAGSVMVMVSVSVQPFASVTVTV